MTKKTPEEILKKLRVIARTGAPGTVEVEVTPEAFSELESYYREKIKKVMPKKMEETEMPKHAYSTSEDMTDWKMENSYIRGHNQAIDAILNEIDKKMR